MSQAFLLVEKLLLHYPTPLVNYNNYIFYTCIRYIDDITKKYHVVCVKGYYPSFDKNIFYTSVKKHQLADVVLWNRFNGEIYSTTKV